MAKSTATAESRKVSNGWKKPYDDFPLSYHPPSGRLYKKIKGRRHYFGYANDWHAAVEKYNDQRDDLHAGRKPRKIGDGCTVAHLCNHFLTAKRHQLDTGELSARSWHDYKRTTDRTVAVFGTSRLVDDLAADDFIELRADIAKTRGPVSLGNEIQRTRVVFKYAYDAGLIDKPVRYGPTFKRPSKAVLRRERQKNGSKMFEPAELNKLMTAADTSLRAMILLALNCGFGNSDLGNLPESVVDLEKGWVDFPRTKTAIPRRAPLWPETVAALKLVLAERPTPKDEYAKGKVFVTKYGQAWSKNGDADKARTASPISAEFRKLLVKCKAYRKGRSFYALRHCCQTIGEEAGETATRHIMGHSDPSMSATYREHISDERLRAVTDHVRTWLLEGNVG